MLLAAAVSAACLSFATPGTSAAAVGEKVFGIHQLNSPAEAPGIAAQMADLGAQSHRWDLSWQVIEPQAPQNGVHKYNFSYSDALYAADLARGIKPLIVLMNAPKWAWGNDVPQGDQPFGMPPGRGHLDDWAQFVTAAARRYPQALGFEVWNEPDAWAFWGRGVLPIDPVAYSRVLARAHEAVKSVDRCKPVIGGAVAAYSTTEPGVHLSVNDFVGGMLSAGAANHMDAVSLHDYPLRPFPPAGSDYQVPFDWVRNLLAHNGVRMPIWITESGVSTTGPSAVSEQGQAESLASLYQWFQSQPDVEALFIHTLLERGTNPLDRGVGYGLISEGLSPGPKPAYYALRDATRQTPSQQDPEPGLQASIPDRQKVLRRGKLRVVVRCLDCCSVQAQGRLKLRVRGLGKSRYRLRPDESSLKPDSSTVLELRLRRKQMKKLRRRTDRIQGPLRARVTILARDADGAVERRRLAVTLRVKR